MAARGAASLECAPVRPQVELSQESIFDFLSSTGLPLVSRLGSLLRWLAGGLTLLCLCLGLFALLWWEDGLWTAALPWAGALPLLAAMPLNAVAFGCAVRGRMQAAALALFAGLFLLSALAAWPRGAFNPAWYVQPVLALLATCCLGIVPGLSLTLFAVTVLLAVPLVGDPRLPPGLGDPELWAHATSLAAVVLASALTGALVHKLLQTSLESAERQRRRHRDAARALRYREKLLRHAMRLETVGDLAGLVTHQLRNAFQVMLGHVALDRMDDSAEAAQRLAMVGETLSRSQPLLDQLMRLAHPEEGRQQVCDLGAIAADFHERLRRLMPRSIEVEFRPADGELPVLLDPAGLEHALWNLAINARQAMGTGGALRLAAGCSGGTAFVSVADTGQGIPAEIRGRVFDPYFTTKPPGEGTGLGLAAVDRFVRASNGSVRLASEPGRGSTFWLEFPLHERPVGLPPGQRVG